MKNLKEKLIEMDEQNIFEIKANKITDEIKYPHLYFLKINNNKYLACNQLVGFVYGSIIEENYMTIEKVMAMINESFQMGYIFVDIYNPSFPHEIV